MTHIDSADAACRNCGTETNGKYCHACGQKSVVHRLTLGHLVSELPHAVFHVDRGFGITFTQLLRHPGETINNYLDGKRARYFNPLTFLVIWAGVSAFLYSQYPFNYVVGAAASMPPEIGAKYEAYLRGYYRYQSLLLVLYLPLLAGLTRLLFRNSGRVYGEHLVINAFMFAMLCAVNALMFPICVVAEAQGMFLRSMQAIAILMIIVQTRTWYQVFRPSGRAWTTALLVAVGMVIYLLFTFVAPNLIFSWVYMRL
jgi:Protein of unknown function (DUF3667)